MDDWRTSLDTILSQAQNNLDMRPRVTNDFYTRPSLFPLSPSPTLLPRDQENFYSSSTNRFSGCTYCSSCCKHSQTNSENCRNGANCANHVNSEQHFRMREMEQGYLQQLSVMKMEMVTVKKIVEQFRKDMLFEFDSRTALVSNSIKEEAMRQLEVNQLKLRDDTKKWEDALVQRIEDYDYQKRSQSAMYEQINRRIDLMSQEQSETAARTHGSLLNFKSKVDELIHQLQTINDKHDANYSLLGKKVSQEASYNEHHRLTTRNTISELKESIEDKSNIVSSYQAIQDKWRQNKDEWQKVEKEISLRIGKMEYNNNVVVSELERRTESLEKEGRKRTLKENEMLERLATIEAKSVEYGRVPLLVTQNEGVTQFLFDENMASVNVALENLSSELSRVKRKSNELESGLSILQKKEDQNNDAVKTSYRELNAKFDENERALSKLREELRLTNQGLSRKIMMSESSIDSLKEQIEMLHVSLEDWKRNGSNSTTISLRDSPDIYFEELQRAVATIRSDMDLEIKKMKTFVSTYNNDVGEFRTKQDHLSTIVSQQISSLDTKIEELQIAMKSRVSRLLNPYSEVNASTKHPPTEYFAHRGASIDLNSHTPVFSTNEESMSALNKSIEQDTDDDFDENRYVEDGTETDQKIEQLLGVDDSSDSYVEEEEHQSAEDFSYHDSEKSSTEEEDEMEFFIRNPQNLDDLSNLNDEVSLHSLMEEVPSDVSVISSPTRSIGSHEEVNSTKLVHPVEASENDPSHSLSNNSLLEMKDLSLVEPDTVDNSTLEQYAHDLGIDDLQSSAVSIDDAQSGAETQHNSLTRNNEQEITEVENCVSKIDEVDHFDNYSKDSSRNGWQSSNKEQVQIVGNTLDEENQPAHEEDDPLQDITNENPDYESGNEWQEELNHPIEGFGYDSDHSEVDIFRAMSDDERELSFDGDVEDDALDEIADSIFNDQLVEENIPAQDKEVNRSLSPRNQETTQSVKRNTPTLQFLSRPGMQQQDPSSEDDDEEEEQGMMAAKMFSDQNLRMQAMQTTGSSILSRLKSSPFSKEDDIDIEQFTESNRVDNKQDDEFDYDEF